MKARNRKVADVFNGGRLIYWSQENGEMRRLAQGFYILGGYTEEELVYLPIGAIWKFHEPNGEGQEEYHLQFPADFDIEPSIYGDEEILQIVDDGEQFDCEIEPWDATSPYNFGPEDDLENYAI